MKRKNIILAILPVILIALMLKSCKHDDSSFTIYAAFTQPVLTTSPALKADGTILFTGTTVTLNWASTNADGDAVSWNVYFGTDATSPPLYKSALTTNTVTVPVVDGTTYYWKVDIIDAHKVKTTSTIQTFTAVNGKNPAISMDLTCKTDVNTAVGLDLTPDQTVDLRLLILKKSDLSIVKTIDDGASSESYPDFGTLADGDYVVGVDIYSTINAGDFNKPVNLSLSLAFAQLGMINQTLDFANVMTNAHPCSLYRTYLASVKKVGAIYTITSSVSNMAPQTIVWKGLDDVYPSQITTKADCSGNSMTGLTFGWMLDYWGEIIVSGGTLSYTTTATTITIPLQKYCKTTWNGAAQPEYSIDGTGTIDNSGAFPVWTIKYNLYQSGKTILTAGNGVPAGYLKAVITTKP